MSALRILVADDHELVRQGLRAVVAQQKEWTICAEANNGRDAVALARQHKPHVAVLDISMPELNGLEAARQIRKELPKTEVLILTMHESEQLVKEVLVAGARGYLLKADAARSLISAIDSLAQHKPFFTGKVSSMVLNGFLTPGEASALEREAPGSRLTAREREIVQLVAEGKTSKEIATALGVSVKTVEAHRENIMRKLNFHSVSELVRYAVRNRIIEA